MSDSSSGNDAGTALTRIYLVPYPKVAFLYPTFVVALVAGVWLSMTGQHAVGPDDVGAVVLAWVFLSVLATNLVVLGFDFPRTTSLTLFFCVAAVVLGVVLTFTLKPELFPAVERFVKSIRPVANPTFYFSVAGILGVIYVVILVSVQFDYWEVRPNELLHHHGVLSDLKRFSAPNLRIDKEINDLFEYLLLGSGRLILQPSNERRAIILDNVLFINHKERAITQMLGALQVEVRSSQPPS